MIKNYLRTFVPGLVAALALACIGSGSAHAQQTTPIISIPTPIPGTVIGTDPVPPPPPPSFAGSCTASV